jgi:hypothetical protein
MKMIRDGKAKNDKIDAAKLAGMLRGGLFALRRPRYFCRRGLRGVA